MIKYHDCPQILRDFLSYHENIKGQSDKTISEYYLDLRMFLRFMMLMRADMPYNTPLDDIPILSVDLDFLSKITLSDIFDFLSYLANDRKHDNGTGIGASAAGVPQPPAEPRRRSPAEPAFSVPARSFPDTVHSSGRYNHQILSTSAAAEDTFSFFRKITRGRAKENGAWRRNPNLLPKPLYSCSDRPK